VAASAGKSCVIAVREKQSKAKGVVLAWERGRLARMSSWVRGRLAHMSCCNRQGIMNGHKKDGKSGQ